MIVAVQRMYSEYFRLTVGKPLAIPHRHNQPATGGTPTTNEKPTARSGRPPGQTTAAAWAFPRGSHPSRRACLILQFFCS